jgi:tetratricopeptide (TPR) repeat protein
MALRRRVKGCPDWAHRSLRSKAALIAALGLSFSGILLSTTVRAEEEWLGFDIATNQANQVDRDLVDLGAELDKLKTVYQQPALAKAEIVEQRFREGQILYHLHDYERASVVLLDVVEDPENRSHPYYDRCVYFLAESFRRNGYLDAARTYFESLLPRAMGDNLKDVVLSLMQISADTGNHENAEQYIQRLRSAGNLQRPDVDYIYGKMLYQAGRFDEAYRVFVSFPANVTGSARAAYFAGVTLVAVGRYAEAIPHFQQTIDRLGKTDRTSELRELAYLSLGRLYQELGNVSKAVECYQEVPASSPNLTETLYEVAWAHARAANLESSDDGRKRDYTRALEATELLMAATPDVRTFPEARLLQGNLQIRLGAPGTAYDSFQSIVDSYRAPEQELGKMLSDRATATDLVGQLVKADLAEDEGVLTASPLIQAWAREEPVLQKVVAVQKGLLTSARTMSEAEELLDALDAALSGEQRFRMRPGLAEARTRALAVQNRLLNAENRLLVLERRIVRPALTASERQQLLVLRGRWAKLPEQLGSLPESSDAVVAERSRVRDAYRSVGLRTYQRGLDLASMRAQVNAARVWLNQQRDKLSPEEIELMDARVGKIQAEMQEVQKEIDDTQRKIRKAIVIAEGELPRRQTLEARNSFDVLSGEELLALASYRARVDPALQGVLLRIDQQRDAIRKMRDSVAALDTSLEEQVATAGLEAREALVAEAKSLGVYREELAGLRASAELSLDPVAHETVAGVHAQFVNMLRRADVGIVDVAWARKFAQTQKVTKAVTEQAEEVAELENEFADVLAED